jgi:hypothetical protein
MLLKATHLSAQRFIAYSHQLGSTVESEGAPNIDRVRGQIFQGFAAPTTAHN